MEEETKKGLITLALSLALAGIVIFFISKFKGKKKKSQSAAEILGVGSVKNKHMKTFFDFKTKYTGDLPSDMTAFTKEAEGGQVTAKTDHASTYSKVSTQEPVHTNIGITREVFDKYASILGYDNSYLNFLRMPADVWYKIFSTVYVKPFAKISSVPVINDMLAGWGWGSGVGTALNSLKKFLQKEGHASLDELIKAKGVAYVFEKLVLHRMDFFKNISAKYDPPTAKEIKKAKAENRTPVGQYLDGWMNREANFYNIFVNYLN